MSEIINIGGVDCYEKDGTAYLKLETVARGLGFTTTQNVGGTEYVNVRWKRVEEYLEEIGFATSGKRPDFIPENIFYRLAMKAKNETAERFQALVADEIIPSIRKHGMYATTDTVEMMLSDPDTAIRLLNQIKEERAKRVALETKIEEDRPLITFANSVSASQTSILVGELAKILRQNGISIGQNRLFAWLRDHGYLIKRDGIDKNMPTQKSMDMGLFEIKETAISHADGHVTIQKTPKVTGKGQIYFINKFVDGMGEQA